MRGNIWKFSKELHKYFRMRDFYRYQMQIKYYKHMENQTNLNKYYKITDAENNKVSTIAFAANFCTL